MKDKFLKILKWFGITIGSLIGIILLTGILFLNLSPQFGGILTEEQKIEFAKTGHFENGKFINFEKIEMVIDCHSITQMLKEFFQPVPDLSPKSDIKVQKIAKQNLIAKPDSLTRITWFGHSTFLIELDGKIILIDPIFSQYAAPHSLLGRKRYNSEMPIEIEELPQIDAIVISHDHYDHLDYPSIEKLKSKTKEFFVPLGVGNHLKVWDIKSENIHEMDWWNKTKLGTIDIICTPSRHMSGRGINDQSCTLWSSWVLNGKNDKIYFSGDGGYGEHFKEIGEKYGPFDVGLMECGQYNILWKDVHMMPEETVQAGFDVKAELILPIHWGAFTLATHSWTDPIERVTAKAHEMKMPISTPQIGEPLILGETDFPKSKWWEWFK